MSDPSTPTLDLSPATLSRSVNQTLDQALASVPADQDGAFLLDGTYDGTNPNVQAMVAFRVGKTWKVGTGVDWAGGGHVAGNVVVSHTWKWKTDDAPKSSIATAAQLGIHDGGNGESAQ